MGSGCLGSVRACMRACVRFTNRLGLSPHPHAGVRKILQAIRANGGEGEEEASGGNTKKGKEQKRARKS